MSISLGSRTIADPRFEGVHGMRTADGCMLRLTVSFNVFSFEGSPPPIVVFGPSRVYVNDGGSLFLGMAVPEVPQPFRVGMYGQTSRLLFELQLTPTAMEKLERLRDGGGLTLTLKLQPEIRTPTELHAGFEDVACRINASDWQVAREQAGCGRSLLFEVPLPDDVPGIDIVAERMEAARRHLALGHYSEVVAACRVALEALTKGLGQHADMTAVLQIPKSGKHQLDLYQRELLMRQSVTDFCSLALHVTTAPIGEMFDRNAAQLVLGSTAALVSSGLTERARAGAP